MLSCLTYIFNNFFNSYKPTTTKQIDIFHLAINNKMPTKLFYILSLLVLSSSKLIIQSPPELKAKLEQQFPQGIPYSVANYGEVPFGKSLTGTIFVSSYLQNCQYQDLDIEAQRSINKVVLSTRGDCTFTTKSLNSQKQGAKLAIIADNMQYEDPGSIVMVDDGKGPQVKIPTILITHGVGEMITDTILNKKQTVSLVVEFQTFKKPVAQVTIWMSSYDRKSYILIRDLQPYLSRISQSIKLTLYHPTTYCPNCPQTDCYNNRTYCINTGFYGYMIQGFGQELIKQQLKEQVIMRKYPKLWWKYMETYDEQCQREDMVDCSIESMKKAGIDFGAVNAEVQQGFFSKTFKDEATGEDKTTLDNKILEQNDRLRYKSGILVFPGIIVNNITYRGNLEALEVFELICESLQVEPEGCDLEPKPQTHSIWKYLVGVAILFILMMAFLLFCYRRQARRQISKNLNSQVNDLVNQYITMYEAQRFDSHEVQEMKPTGSSSINSGHV